MRQELRDEAAAIVEKLARVALASDTISIAMKSTLMGEFWTLVLFVAASEAKGRKKLSDFTSM